MDEREYLAKAQEAQAKADAAHNLKERRRWEEIAEEYRQLAKAMERERRAKHPRGLFDA